MFSVPQLVQGLSSLGVFAQSGGFWLPPPESTSADIVDAVFKLILAVATFFFALIVLLTFLFVVLYRRREGVEPRPSPSQNTALEITWTVIPVAIVIVIFYMGFAGYMDLRTPPEGSAYDIRVTGQRWNWIFTYPNGHVSDRLHVPVDRPVRLTLTSEDVIHSFYVPAFRLKMDVVPGRYNVTWFKARNAGEYDLYCAEYCGKGHSDMLTKVVVHASGTFESWLEEEANLLARMSPADAGAALYRRHGCAGCHSTDGTAGTGPTFKGIYGATHQFSNASPTAVDDNYIREALLEPMAKIRSGYQGVMPTYKGRLKDEEITAIIEFIKTLK